MADKAVARDEMKTRQEICETLVYRLGGLGERRKLPNGSHASGSDNLI